MTAFGVRHELMHGAAVSQSGRLLATWGEDGITRVWDCATGGEVAAIPAEPRDGCGASGAHVPPVRP